MASLTEPIDVLLPQTQCTRCGYPSCAAYAQSIANGRADIDRCAPGGQAGIDALAALLGRTSKPLNIAFGVEAPPTVALIDEPACIGCTQCIQACPVDAIVGAAKRMHTVIADQCTGCGLCLPPCPVDCIALVDTAAAPLERKAVLVRAGHARRRYEARAARLARGSKARRGMSAASATTSTAKPAPITRAAVLEAIARGKARLHAARARASAKKKSTST